MKHPFAKVGLNNSRCIQPVVLTLLEDYAIKILLNAIIQHFREKPQEHVPTKYLSDVDLDLPIVHWSAEQVEVLKNSLDKPHQPQGEEKADVIQLVEILCLFPTEYLSKSERQHALMIAFLLDVWMVTNNIENIEAARICCRGLLLRIINMTKTAGILVRKIIHVTPTNCRIHWFV